MTRTSRREGLPEIGPGEGKSLGFSAKLGGTVGIGITCYDSDSADGTVEATYDWSGASFKEGDVNGFGPLIFK